MPPRILSDDTQGLAMTDLTPDQIANAQFVGSVRGYNREDVDAFLRGVADDYQRILEELRGLRITATAAASPAHRDAPGPEVRKGHEATTPTIVIPTAEPRPVLEDAPATVDQPVAEMTSDDDQHDHHDHDEVTMYAPSPADTAETAADTSTAPTPDPAGLRDILLAADEEAWRIRDAVEEELDHNRVEVMRTMELAIRKAGELRDDARRRARALLDSGDDVAELADRVSRELREADAAAGDVLRRARAETREDRRAMYERLARAEAQARSVLDQAHEQACSLLRGTGDATEGAEAPGQPQ